MPIRAADPLGVRSYSRGDPRASAGGKDITAFRFVHAADIHLDSPLRSLALRDPNLAELIGNATRRAFVRVIDLCLEERVDALLLAGDLYDGEQTSMKTARFLAEQVARMHKAGVRTFIIRGNHDALSKITQELVFPDSVKVFGGRADAVNVVRAEAELPVVIHGLSFAKPHAPDSLVDKYRPCIEGAVNIGIMHTSLAGAPGHDAYAPCSVADLQAPGFDYWALGHIHSRFVVPGRCTIVMPGMPQGRDINEAGAKSVSLVTIGDDRRIHIEERATGVAQFERLTVDVGAAPDWAALARLLGSELARARREIGSEHLVARVRLTGASPLAWRMRSDRDLLKAELDSQASLIGGCWVEKLEIDGAVPDPTRQGTSDALSELRRLAVTEIGPSESFRVEVAAIVQELRLQLPPECRAALGADEEAFAALVSELAQDGTDEVIARLHAAGQGRDT